MADTKITVLGDRAKQTKDRYWWLSFADPAMPKGSGFLGVIIAPGGDHISDPVQWTHDRGINPGGEVFGARDFDISIVPLRYLRRLLTAGEAEEVKNIQRAAYGADAVEQTPPSTLCCDCNECHDGVADQEEFNRRADAMFAALDDIDDPDLEACLIAMAASRFLASFDAKQRRAVRKDLIADIDSETKAMVIAVCDA